MLKLLAISTSYGIFAELNVQTCDRPRAVKCDGANRMEAITGAAGRPAGHIFIFKDVDSGSIDECELPVQKPFS